MAKHRDYVASGKRLIRTTGGAKLRRGRTGDGGVGNKPRGMLWDRSSADLRRLMERVNASGLQVRFQYRNDATVFGGAGKIPSNVSDSFFLWHANYMKWHYATYPDVSDSSFVPADDAIWKQTLAYEKDIQKWSKQYEAETGKTALGGGAVPDVIESSSPNALLPNATNVIPVVVAGVVGVGVLGGIGYVLVVTRR